jgi:hypothetical protein
MKRFIKCSTSSCKATGRTWSEFIRNIESTLGYEVDSAYRRTSDQLILMYLDGAEYEGEVTRYSDGTYELICDNIYPARM